MTRAFGGLATTGLELFTIASPVGGLSAFRAMPASPSRGVAVFVPGFTGSKEDFRLLLPLVAALGWEAVGYSQRGQADSAAPDGVEHYRLGDLAADAVLVSRAVGSGRPVHLVGHSLGGLVARAAAIASPADFADLTMLCSGPGGRPGVHQSDAELVSRDGLGALWQPGTSPDDLFLRDRFAASSVANYLGGVDILQHAVDTSDRLRDTGLPVLVAHGETDDAWPQADQRDMATRLGARYETIPGAGHLPNIDNPDRTASLLSEFFTR